MENQKFCQSCGMPLTADETIGTNADESKSEDYCVYCFKDGAFITDETMEQMIESCIPHCINGNPWNSEDEARKAMQEFFPKLKRWAKS